MIWRDGGIEEGTNSAVTTFVMGPMTREKLCVKAVCVQYSSVVQIVIVVLVVRHSSITVIFFLCFLFSTRQKIVYSIVREQRENWKRRRMRRRGPSYSKLHTHTHKKKIPLHQCVCVSTVPAYYCTLQSVGKYHFFFGGTCSSSHFLLPQLHNI